MATQAYIDGDGATGIIAPSVSLSATDDATILANTEGIGVSAAIGGAVAVSVAIGLAIAFNTIANDVQAYIHNAGHGVTATNGGIALSSSETAAITAVTVAAGVAIAGGGGPAVAAGRRGRLRGQRDPRTLERLRGPTRARAARTSSRPPATSR